MTNDFDWQGLEVFFGEVTSTAARIFARLPQGRLGEGQQLRGVVTGPFCDSSHMLPASCQMRYLGADPQPLAGALVPDPALWAPERPARYRVEVCIERDGQRLGVAERWMGLRHFGPRGRGFYSDGRRTVIRGCDITTWPDGEGTFEVLRENFLHLAPSRPELLDNSALQQAAEQGVPLLPWAPREASATELTTTLRRWADCPAIWSVLLPSTAVERAGAELAAASGNLVLICELSASAELPPWADAAVIQVESPEQAAADARALECPVIMHAPSSAANDFQEARRRCEQLQRLLAPRGHFAGYLV